MQINLKLAVISELMEKDLLAFDDSAFPREGKARATRVLAHFKKLTIAPDLLAQVEHLNPDGGDVVYQAIFGGGVGAPGFQEALDSLCITSLKGIDSCPSLKHVVLDSMVSEDGFSIAPFARLKNLETVDISVAFEGLEALLQCPNLKAVSMGGELSEGELEVVKILKTRGVTVSIE